MDRSCNPPTKARGTTVEAQPGTARAENIAIQMAQTPTTNDTAAIPKPNVVIRRNGRIENDVIRLIARATIFVNGYFDSPAVRSFLS